MKKLSIFLFLLLIVGIVSGVDVIIWPETDGYLGMNTENTYSSLHDSVEADTLNSDSNIIAIRLESGSADGYYDRFYRSVLSFNTSSIPDSATVTGVILRVKGRGQDTGLGIQEIGVTGGVLADNRTIATGDFDSVLPIEFATRIEYNHDYRERNFYFNAAGIDYVQNAITGTSHTILYLRDGWDIDNAPPVWIPGANSETAFSSVDEITESEHPFLYVTYTAPGEPVASFTSNVTAGTVPLAVQFNDASAAFPNSWNWSYTSANLLKNSQDFDNPTYWTLHIAPNGIKERLEAADVTGTRRYLDCI